MTRRRSRTGTTALRLLGVYEVELVDPEVDTNHHRDRENGPFISVMALAGTDTRLVRGVRASSQ